MSDRRFSRGSGGNGGGNPRGPSGGDTGGAAGAAPDFGLSAWDETAEQKPKRDLKKTFLVAGLAILSWVATYVGMLELIEANMGDLPIVHKIIIGFSVAMLMTMVVWLLDQMFQPGRFFAKLAYTGGYLFLTIISIGFGFGFYWKVLESRGEGTRGAETAISSVQAPLQTAAARLESLQSTLIRLKDISSSKAEVERTAGTSCPNSKPGDGPRRKLRDDDAGRFSFASDFVKDRIGQVKTDMGVITADLNKIVAGDTSIFDRSGTRNEFMKAMGRKLDSTVTNFNAFRGDPQLKQIRTDLAERADKSQWTDGQGKTFACPDQQLATMIRAVVASIDALPVLEKPKIVTVEGSDATIEAFRRLTTTFYGLLSFKLPPSADELRELQQRAVTQAEATAGGRAAVPANEQVGQGGLSKRDYVPLSIAIFVDLCLLLVSMGASRSRLQSLVPKMKEAERGPVIQILSRFNEIHRDPQIRENFEIFRHVVFDFNGDYYAAIPLIAPYSVDRRRPNAYNPADVEALQQEAHLLGNFFTSFEQERLFSRVMMPLIPTSRIQKKLWAQGSKFAHAEAFRLYKFKDGAWQEMILGAIMGAAKRVEAEKRTRRIENDVFNRHSPGFGRPVTDPTDLRSADINAHMASAAALAAVAREAAHYTSAGEPEFAAATAVRSFAPSVPRPGYGASGRPAAPPPPPAPPQNRDAGFGALRTSTTGRPANNNTATAPAAAAEATTTIIPATIAIAPASTQGLTTAVEPQPEPGRTVEVEATERSVTYRMNRDDMPATLKAMIDALPPTAGQPELPSQPEIETKAVFDAIDGRALETEQAVALGGHDAPLLPAWDAGPSLAVPKPNDETDAATMARRFGIDRQRA